jgi:hypothetical protein
MLNSAVVTEETAAMAKSREPEKTATKPAFNAFSVEEREG